MSAFRTTVPWHHVLRVLLAIAGITCIFFALKHLPLADVTAISWSSPLFTMVFAAILLSDRVDWRRWVAAMIGFAGVIIMTQPSTASFQLASLMALGAAILVGGELVMLRVIAQRDRTMTAIVVNNGLGVVFSFLLALPVLQWPSLAQTFLLVSVGVLTVIGQSLNLRAFALKEASFIAPFLYVTVIYAFFFGYLFFSEVPTWSIYIGTLLIISSGIYIAQHRTST